MRGSVSLAFPPAASTTPPHRLPRICMPPCQVSAVMDTVLELSRQRCPSTFTIRPDLQGEGKARAQDLGVGLKQNGQQRRDPAARAAVAVRVG